MINTSFSWLSVCVLLFVQANVRCDELEQLKLEKKQLLEQLDNKQQEISRLNGELEKFETSLSQSRDRVDQLEQNEKHLKEVAHTYRDEKQKMKSQRWFLHKRILTAEKDQKTTNREIKLVQKLLENCQKNLHTCHKGLEGNEEEYNNAICAMNDDLEMALAKCQGARIQEETQANSWKEELEEAKDRIQTERVRTDECENKLKYIETQQEEKLDGEKKGEQGKSSEEETTGGVQEEVSDGEPSLPPLQQCEEHLQKLVEILNEYRNGLNRVKSQRWFFSKRLASAEKFATKFKEAEMEATSKLEKSKNTTGRYKKKFKDLERKMERCDDAVKVLQKSTSNLEKHLDVCSGKMEYYKRIVEETQQPTDTEENDSEGSSTNIDPLDLLIVHIQQVKEERNKQDGTTEHTDTQQQSNVEDCNCKELDTIIKKNVLQLNEMNDDVRQVGRKNEICQNMYARCKTDKIQTEVEVEKSRENLESCQKEVTTLEDRLEKTYDHVKQGNIEMREKCKAQHEKIESRMEVQKALLEDAQKDKDACKDDMDRLREEHDKCKAKVEEARVRNEGRSRETVSVSSGVTDQCSSEGCEDSQGESTCTKDLEIATHQLGKAQSQVKECGELLAHYKKESHDLKMIRYFIAKRQLTAEEQSREASRKMEWAEQDKERCKKALDEMKSEMNQLKLQVQGDGKADIRQPENASQDVVPKNVLDECQRSLRECREYVEEYNNKDEKSEECEQKLEECTQNSSDLKQKAWIYETIGNKDKEACSDEKKKLNAEKSRLQEIVKDIDLYRVYTGTFIVLFGFALIPHIVSCIQGRVKAHDLQIKQEKKEQKKKSKKNR